MTCHCLAAGCPCTRMNPGPSNWANPWQPFYPNAYAPPVYPTVTFGSRLYGQSSNWVSSKYKTLNPILASDTTTLIFDVRKNPKEGILRPIYESHWQSPATSNLATHLRLISKEFPWTIDCKGDSPIRCETVWDALYLGLQQPILDAEWALIVNIGKKKQREAMEAAAKKRLASLSSSDKQLKRIDYLGEAALFKGLEKDDDFVKLRLLPGDKSIPETWVVKFG